jgi:hypothetical protein
MRAGGVMARGPKIDTPSNHPSGYRTGSSVGISKPQRQNQNLQRPSVQHAQLLFQRLYTTVGQDQRDGKR